jgi:hypothetical protein
MKNIRKISKFGCKFSKKRHNLLVRRARDVIQMSSRREVFNVKMTILCKFPCLRRTIEGRTFLSPELK